jgi:hypothetical protein
MGKRIERWVADDGTEFESEAAMLTHEMNLLDYQEIDIFMESYDCAERKRGEYSKAVKAWQAYRNSHMVQQLRTKPKGIARSPVHEVEPPRVETDEEREARELQSSFAKATPL